MDKDEAEMVKRLTLLTSSSSSSSAAAAAVTGFSV